MHNMSQAPLEALVQALEQDDVSLKQQIVGELSRRGRAGELDAIPALVRLLGNDDAYLAEAAGDALWSIGEPALQPTIQVLGDKAATLAARFQAARTLTYLRDPRSARALIHIVSDSSEDLGLRRVVALYAGRTQDSGAFEPLVAIVANEHEDAELRALAAAGLGELNDPRAVETLLSVLRSGDIQFHPRRGRHDQKRIDSLQGEGSEPATGRALEPAELAQPSRSLHSAVLNELRGFQDSRILPTLLPMLTEDGEARTGAAAVIGSLGLSAMPALLQALTSENPRSRAGAAEALGYVQDRGAIAPLARALEHDPDGTVRALAASSLGFHAAPSVPAILVQALEDNELGVRLAGAQALYGLALAGQFDAVSLPALSRLAEPDNGTFQGDHVVQDAARRALREVQRRLGLPLSVRGSRVL